jgi:hypothetical protein
VPDINDQYVAASPSDVTTDEEVGSPLSIPAVRRFADAVSREVDEQITEDVVEARLAEVRRRALAGRTGEQSPAYAQELARYGYTLVRVWLQVVRVEMQGTAAIGRLDVSLDETEIHKLAKDTAARAIAKFREEQPGDSTGAGSTMFKSAFLNLCLKSLPGAYAARRLQLGRLGSPQEALDPSSAGAHLVEALRHCFTERRQETSHLLQSWTDSDEQRDEIIELTCRVLDFETSSGAERRGFQPDSHAGEVRKP